MKLIFINLFFLVLSISTMYGQRRDIKVLPPHKKHKVAHKMVESGSYYRAVDPLKNLINLDSNNLAYIYNLGEAYFFARDYKNAEKFLNKAVELDPKQTTLAMFRYAETLKYNGRYVEAKTAFTKFIKGKYEELKTDQYRTIAKNEVNSCAFALKIYKDSNDVDITHLGDHVNSSYSEFSPRPKDDTTLIFASLQSDSVLIAPHNEAHFFHVKLYKTNHNGQVWYIPQELKELNSKFESTANGVYNTDQTKFYFTRCRANEKGKMICAIYVSDVKDGKFMKPKKLHKGINRKGYTSTQPIVSTIGSGKKKSEVLLFTSDRPDGIGGLDIWYMTINPDGTFGQVTNMGKNVNTIRDEMSPYYNEEEGALYFSSNYHYGLGGYDIFKAKGKIGKFLKPVNIGVPLNTRVDDTYYTINLKKKEGYLVSNRPGGYVLTSETCCDDIYSFQYRKQNVFALSFKDKKTGKIIPNVNVLATVKRSAEQVEGDSLYSKYDQSKQYDQRKIFTLRQNRMYSLNANKNGYDSLRFGFNSKGYEINQGENESLKEAEVKTVTSDFGDTTFITLVMNVQDSSLIAKNEKTISQENNEVVNVKEHTISKVIGETENKLKTNDNTSDLRIIINYDFDQSNFFEKNKKGLDSLMQLLNKYPELKIEISSHTDNKGSLDYNTKLSEKRAKEVFTYLNKHGLAKNRMTAKGYSELMPIAPNENPDGSDNPEGRAMNRRAEIKIIAPEK